MVNPHIFRQYDIRGVVGEDVDAGVAEQIGRAFATLLRRDRGGAEGLRIALGRDNRLTSNELADAVSRGIRAAGCDVVDVGTVPTPVHSFACAYLETDGGLQVTGSHNPPQYNGFKLQIAGSSLYGAAIQEVLRIIREADYASGSGVVHREEMLQTYVREVSAKFQITRPLKVVFDCGNGNGQRRGPGLLLRLGIERGGRAALLRERRDLPEPPPRPGRRKNLRDLIAAVRAKDADLGVGFDGDADRIGVVDARARSCGATTCCMHLRARHARAPGADARASRSSST